VLEATTGIVPMTEVIEYSILTFFMYCFHISGVISSFIFCIIYLWKGDYERLAPAVVFMFSCVIGAGSAYASTFRYFNG